MSRSLSPDEFNKIQRAVKDIESKSCVEVVPVLLPRSGSYTTNYLIFSGLLSLSFLFWSIYNPWTLHHIQLLPAQIVLIGGFVYWLVSTIPFLSRLLSTTQQRKQQVQSQATLLFHQKQIFRTLDHSGLLILYSQLENHIEITPDVGITDNISEKEWAALLKKIQPQPKETPAESMTRAIYELSPLVSHYLPKQVGDIDELSNQVVSKL
jgi:putative membrane protein